MATLRRRPYTIPLPAAAKITTSKGKRFAEFKNSKGRVIKGELTETPLGQRVRLLSRKWYGEYYDPSGRLHVVPLYTDQAASQTKLAELVKRAERGDAGMTDPFEQHRKRPLGEHLDDFQRFLTSKGNTASYAKRTAKRVRQALDGCRFRLIRDISPSALIDWLADQRQANVMGIKTSNYYLRDVKGFCRWLVRDRRTDVNPLAHLTGMNADVETGRERRALDDGDFAKLIAATNQGPTRGTIPGPDRAMLYLVAANTGFRAHELSSLTPESFELSGENTGVTVEASYSKRRRTDVQPLRGDLVALLRGYLAAKQPGAPIWPGEWWNVAASSMVKPDLAAAGLSYVDDSGRVFDFHALRHQFISNLAAAGVHPKVAQKLARHSTITLTMDRYTHLGIHDHADALDKLPKLPDLEPKSEATELAATGTEGAAQRPLRLRSACAEAEKTPSAVRTDETIPVSRLPKAEIAKTAKKSGYANDCDRPIMSEREQGPRGGMADTGDLKSPSESTQTPSNSSSSENAPPALALPLPNSAPFGPDLAELLNKLAALSADDRQRLLDLLADRR